MDYPWYQVTRGAGLEQGDILESCPVFLPRADSAATEPDTILLDEELRDVIVISQSCDLVTGREKISEVLLCPLWHRAQFTTPHYLATAKGMEEVRRGTVPGFHLLAPCGEPGFEREVRVVDFRRLYSLPVAFFRREAEKAGPRLRLLRPTGNTFRKPSPASSCASVCRWTSRRFVEGTCSANLLSVG